MFASQTSLLTPGDSANYDSTNIADSAPLSNENELQEDKDGKVEPVSLMRIFGPTFNLSHAILGAGILGVPYAVKLCGLGLGVSMVIIISLITDYSLHILVKSGITCGKYTYQDVMNEAFGKPGYVLANILLFLLPFIMMISYNIFVGDGFTKVAFMLGGDKIRHSIWGRRELYIVLANIAVMIPISLYKNVIKLEKYAAVAIVIVLMLCALIIYGAVQFGDAVKYHGKSIDSLDISALSGVAMISLSLECHHNAFFIWNSISEEPKTRERLWPIVRHIGFFLAFSTILIVGTAGSVTFRQLVQGNLFMNFCADDIFANVVSTLYLINIMFIYPFELFVVRQVVDMLLFGNSGKLTLLRHVLETIAISLLCLVFSLTTECISVILEFNGVFVTTPIAFIMPTLCYLVLHKPILQTSNVLCILLLVFGVITFLLGIVQLIFRLIKSPHTILHCIKANDMPYCSHLWMNNTYRSQMLR
ncbi:putative sodium-coupled neutral amino acid transporter 11 isoform X1 [Tubulanus polymorphus]|uniref:putative sodium-coupled neutral amino acid transporter 11 isoform X1 n=1 Tax=Tubulanus polymorphus TaxID=672921 RepID=UPI003DA1DA9E